MNLKKMRKQMRDLEAAATAKLGEIKADTSVEDAQRIEREHADLVRQIAVLERSIRAAKEASGSDADASDMDDEDDKDEDDDDDSAQRAAPGGKAAPATVLSRSALIELGLVFDQARGLGVDLGSLPEAITKNETPDAARKRMFEALAAKSKDNGPESSTVEIIRDEREGVADAMECALVQRLLNSRGRSFAIEYKPVTEADARGFDARKKQAEQYRGLSLVELAAQAIGYRGRGNFLTIGDAQKIFERAFQSTGDFPQIFQNALNKALLARYQLAAPTYREIAAERSFVDFRPHPQVRAGDFPTLQEVTQTGELKYGTTTDSGEAISVTPYGVIFTISRTMLVNDDLGAIDQILGSAGEMVLVFENTTFYSMFNSNPALKSDSTAVFHANHGNLGTAAVPSVASIGEARKLLREQKNISGNLINVPPSIILTGPQQETAADQMVASITPTLSTSVNPFSGKLRSVSDANITGTEWYIAAEPARVPTFVYGFLAGSGGPRTRTYEPFGVQGVKVSLEHDFGVGAIDFRGFVKNPGA